MVSEEYPNNYTANKALDACVNLENRLLQSCGDMNLYKKIKR